MRWEYKDLAIPLGLTSEFRGGGGDEFTRAHDSMVLKHLQRAGEEGWQADESTDWASV
jgi:hypothetical protein